MDNNNHTCAPWRVLTFHSRNILCWWHHDKSTSMKWTARRLVGSTKQRRLACVEKGWSSIMVSDFCSPDWVAKSKDGWVCWQAVAWMHLTTVSIPRGLGDIKVAKLCMIFWLVQIMCTAVKLSSCWGQLAAAQLCRFGFDNALVTRNVPTIACQLVSMPKFPKGGFGKLAQCKMRRHIPNGAPHNFLSRNHPDIAQGR